MTAFIITRDQRLIEEITDVFKICLPGLKPIVCHAIESVPALVRAKKPAIIIIDCVSENSSIASLTGNIRRLTASPIVALCCYDSPKWGVSAIKSGADLCLFKPVVQLEFVAHVIKLLENNN
ncbi:MAG: hypothetical protein PHG26_05255 [Dehalococcoidales bacterium]|nr:hypothetical protein [Dehalococcoidales bacterium]